MKELKQIASLTGTSPAQAREIFHPLPPTTQEAMKHVTPAPPNTALAEAFAKAKATR